MAGVDASLGWSCADVASTAMACRLSDNGIMEALDWASARMLFAENLWLLPASVLSMTEWSVQQALDPDL